jgi:hypothetical protein
VPPGTLLLALRQSAELGARERRAGNQRGPHNARCRASCRVPDFRGAQTVLRGRNLRPSGTADGAFFGKDEHPPSAHHCQCNFMALRQRLHSIRAARAARCVAAQTAARARPNLRGGDSFCLLHRLSPVTSCFAEDRRVDAPDSGVLQRRGTDRRSELVVELSARVAPPLSRRSPWRATSRMFRQKCDSPVPSSRVSRSHSLLELNEPEGVNACCRWPAGGTGANAPDNEVDPVTLVEAPRR